MAESGWLRRSNITNERFWGVTLDLSTIYLSIYLSTHRPILMFHYFIFFCLYVILFVTWGRRVQWWVSRCRVSASGPCAGRGRTRSRCLAPLLKYKRILTILEPAASGAFFQIYMYNIWKKFGILVAVVEAKRKKRRKIAKTNLKPKEKFA